MAFGDASKSVPFIASIGQACHQCFKVTSDGITLRRCAKCRNVSYCSAACQKGNWKDHKEICNALNKLDGDKSFGSKLGHPLPTEPPAKVSDLNALIESTTRRQIDYIRKELSGELETEEINLMKWEPRCMGCGQSERILRFEAVEKKAVPRLLTPCPDCKMAFYCSKDHWDAVKNMHSTEPCQDGYGGKTQCQMNQDLHQDAKLAIIHNEAVEKRENTGPFHWLPRSIKASWVPLKNTHWDTEYASDASKTQDFPDGMGGSFMRAATEGLSLPLTILWALENLNTDDAWTRKETLIIHVIDAYEVEFLHGKAFEEILHRLPEVTMLKVILCGPNLSHVINSRDRGRDIDIGVCNHCTTAKRKRLNQMFAQNYCDFARIQGNFVKPDLAVHFNLVGSQGGPDGIKTMEFLVNNNIPTVITAYNRREAEGNAKIMRRAGAQLNPALGPVKNPWGSRVTKPEPYKVTGFYSMNSWLAGGFQ